MCRPIESELLPCTPADAIERPHPEIVRSGAALESRASELRRAQRDILIGPLRNPIHHKVPACRIGCGIPELIGRDRIAIRVAYTEQARRRDVLAKGGG